ncbi:MAG: PilT/PilU family type 4a pilus ATPase [Candidatus Eremiobacteraeota bacterium]|nr:PilT/PilU family type 4a pilus ATPase [Candidatus Eremiobacteraeota bacterium]
MRARIEELEEGPVEDEAFEELDALVKRFEEFQADQSQAQRVLAERLGELIVRVDSVGGLGRIEDVPRLLEEAILNRLDERLHVLGENLEARFRTLESKEGGVSTAQMEQLTTEVEASVSTLRDELDQVLRETQHELSQALQEAASQEQVEALAEKLEGEITRSRQHVDESIANIRQELGQEQFEEVRRLVADKANVSELETVRESIEELANSAGLSERAREALRRLEELANQGSEWEERLTKLLERSEASAKIVESHHEKVQLAVKLVNLLEEKARSAGSSFEGAPAAVSEEDDTQLGFELDDLLQVMTKHGASDLHLKVGQPPTVRLEGELIPVGNQPLSRSDCRRLVFAALDGPHRAELMKTKDLEFSYESPGARFRINAFMERGNLSAAFKMISSDCPELDALGLPKSLQKLAGMPNGLVLVCANPGGGRTTTLAALVNYLNTNRKARILTLEERLAYHHEDKMALVTQREVGVDLPNLEQGLLRALYQDPDVIVVTDLPDAATAEAALAAASSGRLVLAGLRSSSSEQAILRLVGLFPKHEKKLKADQLSVCLRGISSQRLLQRKDGAGLVPAVEVMVSTPTIAGLIAEGNLSAISKQIYEGIGDGMQTMAQSLSRLVESGLVDQEEAIRHAEPTPAAGGDPPPPPSRPPTPPPPGQTGGTSAPSTTVNEQDTLMNWL